MKAKKTEKGKKGICIYCGKLKELTKDHVPPDSFFPKPRPSNLITVPSCYKCNQEAGKDEELFLATFMFSQAGVTEVGRKLWDQKLHRMYLKNWGLRRRISKSLHLSETYTPSGIYLGRNMVINAEAGRCYRVVSKIVRGLYFFEFSQALPSSTEIICHLLQKPQEFKAAEEHMHHLNFGSRQWPGIFEYRFNRVAAGHEGSMWLVRFFKFPVFWVISSNKDVIQEVAAKRPRRPLTRLS